MNRKTKFILGVCLTLLVSTLLAFGVLHYVPWTVSNMFVLYLILFLPTCPGITASFWIYQNGSLRAPETPEAPLMDEDAIHDQLTKDKAPPGDLAPAETETEVIAPGHEIIPVPTTPSEAIKAVMQNKVIEALQKCKCEVSINTDMDLEGNFKEPKITVSFIPPTPAPATPKPEQKKPEKKNDEETLTRPRI